MLHLNAHFLLTARKTSVVRSSAGAGRCVMDSGRLLPADGLKEDISALKILHFRLDREGKFCVMGAAAPEISILKWEEGESVTCASQVDSKFWDESKITFLLLWSLWYQCWDHLHNIWTLSTQSIIWSLFITFLLLLSLQPDKHVKCFSFKGFWGQFLFLFLRIYLIRGHEIRLPFSTFIYFYGGVKNRKIRQVSDPLQEGGKIYEDIVLGSVNLLHIWPFAIWKKVTAWQSNELFDRDIYSGDLQWLLDILGLHPTSWRKQLSSWMAK